MADSLAVELRESSGKGGARKLRQEGRVPAVLYGHGVDPVHLQFDPDKLDYLLSHSHAGANTLIDLEGASEVAGKTVLVKEMQRHPVRGHLLHADLYAINMTETVSVAVPIELIGTPKGVSLEGGLLDHALREVELECLPRAIPDSIELDVSALMIGDSVHVSDLALPQGVELLSDPELSVASVVAPRVEEEPEPEEGAEAVAGEAAEAVPTDEEGDASKEEESKADD